jgi:23S rRNA (uridine2479-2'-O)-methyltransferase
MAAATRVSSRNARFQQWSALLGNRTKRQRAGQFVVQGVRPVTLAVEHGWTVAELLYDADTTLSRWAVELSDRVGRTAARYAVSGELLRELGGKDGATPELLAVVRMPADDLDRIAAGPDLLAVVFDRPTSPGNLGTLIRSADAFGASGVVVTGHAADVYDPQTVRASTGSLFALPVVRAASHREVLDWVAGLRASGLAVRVVGTDESAAVDVAGYPLTGPVVLLVGNETAGLSTAWREAADDLVRIPIGGAASSLNAATAGSVVLYEAARQRSHI